ncbi:hypothetical protein [Pedobacter duraquae]|uniref:Lipocalin-like protein n=1 Tax=Pedobacter duraquae TaxID=425511 RepID=A0A4R6IE16_9SPHI|nr:hypothetical protein [Pedobacter duraquae]TDO20272.1 hypothetical protein CLV32_4032 [Pedobacter duraquae]
MLTISCKKSDGAADQPNTPAVLKTKILGKWKLIGGSYTTYDVNGKVVNTTDLGGRNPIPLYEFRDDDKLYVTDSGEQKVFFYTVSITAEGKMRILIDSAEYYDIGSINSTDMIWLQDLKAKEDEPGTIKTAHTEVRFQKM